MQYVQMQFLFWATFKHIWKSFEFAHWKILVLKGGFISEHPGTHNGDKRVNRMEARQRVAAELTPASFPASSLAQGPNSLIMYVKPIEKNVKM